VRQYAKCEKDGATLWFRTDFIGRVTAVCPTCDEGHPPPPKPKEPEDWGTPELDEIVCQNQECRKIFVPKTTWQKCCCRECTASLRNLGRTGRKPKSCAIASCRKPFLPSANHHIYCSRACAKIAEREKYRQWMRQRTLHHVTR